MLYIVSILFQSVNSFFNFFQTVFHYSQTAVHISEHNSWYKNSQNMSTKILKIFSAKFSWLFPPDVLFTHHTLHVHTYTRYACIHAYTRFSVSFPVFSVSLFPFFFFRLFPFLFPFLLKCLKIVHSCVSFPFPSQYPTFSLKRNHERFFAVLNDFTNAF